MSVDSSGACGVWQNVGVHPTPALLVRHFADRIAGEVDAAFEPGSAIDVLDGCAGDGRLGHAVARRLLRRGFVPRVKFIESNTARANSIRRAQSYMTEVSCGDFFDSTLRGQSSVVVSNPPYLALGRRHADAFDLRWSDVVEGGRNLYGLALLQCIRLCAPGGIIGFLGPHGWLTNQRAGALREQAKRHLANVTVDAFSSRRLFPGVHQDTAIQVAHKRRNAHGSNHLPLLIGYDGAAKAPLDQDLATDLSRIDGARVRVGAFVWNRQSHLIAGNGRGLPVVYGGSIGANGKLLRGVARYAKRSHLVRSKVPSSYICKSPCILVKRSMRGHPGDWRLDVCTIAGKSHEFVAENHVIVVELPGANILALKRIAAELHQVVERAHKHYGHPNVSVALIRSATARVFGRPDQEDF
jgi:hypothetical protein